jgi:hypothetical protein
VLGDLGFVLAELSASCCHGDFIEGLSEKISVRWGRRVTPEFKRDMCLLARLMAANLHFAQMKDLMFEVEKPLPNANLFLSTHLLRAQG